MIFPPDAEIREYAAYEVRTRKIILEEFKHEYGKEPNELEIPELLRAAIIPIGFLPKQNGFQKSLQDQPSFSNPSFTLFHSLLGISLTILILDCDFLSRFCGNSFRSLRTSDFHPPCG